MKQHPDLQRIQRNMVDGPLASYSFLGEDLRSLIDIIADDQQTVTGLGLTHRAIAARLEYFTRLGRETLGTPLVVDGTYQVILEEHKGSIPCPFGDNHQANKGVVAVTNLELQKSLSWAELNIHLIAEHGFYEGYGAVFRLEPSEIAEVLGAKDGKWVVKDPLEFAMLMELEGMHYYKERAKVATHDHLHQIFTALSLDEDAHYRLVKELKSASSGSLQPVDSRSNIQGIFLAELAGNLREELSYLAAYQHALDMEKRSIDLYYKLADEAKDSKTRRVFKRLAKEEEDHHLILWRITELLQRPEEWYPYLND